MFQHPLLQLTGLFLSFFLLPASALAATWKAIDASYQGLDYFFAGAYFTDGQYNASQTSAGTLEQILSVEPARPASSNGFSFHIGGNSGFLSVPPTPPQVDLANMRVNFNSLFFNLFDQQGIYTFDWGVGSPDWIPIVDNGDGSYLVRWTTPAIPTIGVESAELRMTVARVSEVPMPSPALLFGSG